MQSPVLKRYIEQRKESAKTEVRWNFAEENPEFFAALKKSPYYNATQEEIGKIYADEPDDTPEQDEFGISRRF